MDVPMSLNHLIPVNEYREVGTDLVFEKQMLMNPADVSLLCRTPEGNHNMPANVELFDVQMSNGTELTISFPDE